MDNKAPSLLKRPLTLVTIGLIGLFAVIVLRRAWLCDDAYITFRTVDNFVNGYGLTWNVGERVQAYTNPLWMFVVSVVFTFTREIYFTSILLSWLISIAVMIVLAWRVARSEIGAAFAVFSPLEL